MRDDQHIADRVSASVDTWRNALAADQKQFIEEEGDKLVKNPNPKGRKDKVKVKSLPHTDEGKDLFDDLFGRWADDEEKNDKSGKPSPSEETEQPKPKPKPGLETYLQNREKVNDELNNLAKKNFDGEGGYLERVEKMREAGDLPDRKTAAALVRMGGIQNVPEDIRRDPEKIKQLAAQQHAQSLHERRVAENVLNSIDKFLDQQDQSGKKVAIDDAKMAEFLSRANKEAGRSIVTKKKAASIKKSNSALDEIMSDPNAEPEEKEKAKAGLMTVLKNVIRPMKPWKWRQKTKGSTMKMQAVFDNVAQALEARGSRELAYEVDVLAAKWPQMGGDLPAAPKFKAGEDFLLQTGDYQNDLGFPPYDKPRSKSKGDESDENTAPDRGDESTSAVATGAHHQDGKDIYVDSTFINFSKQVPNTKLEHMGFGEFSLKTPWGTVEFDRMRGKPFKGQEGRSHKLYDDADGKAVKKLVQQMEKMGLSVQASKRD